MLHHQIDRDALAWAENSFSTVLGALILILTGRVQRANGTPPTNGNGVNPPSPIPAGGQK